MIEGDAELVEFRISYTLYVYIPHLRIVTARLILVHFVLYQFRCDAL